MKSIKTILPIAAFAGLALSANAAVTVITPTGVVETVSEFAGIENTINGIGLSGGGTSGDILSETHTPSGGGDHVLFGGGPDYTTASATFTVPVSTVNQVHLWLYRGSSWGTFTAFDLEFSTDAIGTDVGLLTFGNTQSIAFDGAAADLSVVQTRTFAEQTGVTHIRLSNATGVLITGSTNSHGGFNEIRFGSDPVPEPTTTALLGLGGLALILRRRK